MDVADLPQDDAAAAPSDAVELRQESLFFSRYAYQQGQKPRPGDRVRFRRDRACGTVFGREGGDGRIYILKDNGDKLSSRTEDLIKDQEAVSLHSFLVTTRNMALTESDQLSFCIFGAHFGGFNGQRYACEPAYLWCMFAVCLCGVLLKGSRAARWLNGKLATSECDPSLLPPPLSDEDIKGLDWERTSPPSGRAPPEKLVEYARKALELGRDMIELAASEGEAPPVAWTARSLATDMATGLQVVLLGPSILEADKGFVEVVELDGLQAYKANVRGLDVSTDVMDPAWFWEVVTSSALAGKGAPAVHWLGMSLIGPTGEPEETDERRMLTVLAAVWTARALATKHSLATRSLKRAREVFKQITTPDRSRLAAIAPELVASAKAKGVSLGTPEALAAVLRQASAAACPTTASPASTR